MLNFRKAICLLILFTQPHISTGQTKCRMDELQIYTLLTNIMQNIRGIEAVFSTCDVTGDSFFKKRKATTTKYIYIKKRLTFCSNKYQLEKDFTFYVVDYYALTCNSIQIAVCVFAVDHCSHDKIYAFWCSSLLTVSQINQAKKRKTQNGSLENVQV